MDSMGSLDTSLPGHSPPKQPSLGTEHFLQQAFKAAALNVTQLYKLAIDSQGKARSEGYQDALGELLLFLDRENIGVSDGEGWKIRMWATERLDGRETMASNLESEDEAEKSDRAPSPTLRRRQSVSHISARTASPIRTESAPPPTLSDQLPLDVETPMLPPQGNFTFRSSISLPQDTDMSSSDVESSEPQIINASIVSHPAHSTSSITISRPNRNSSRHTSQSVRSSRGSSSTLGRGAGHKRRMNYTDFFDVGNLGSKDGFGGGGKRGKFA